MTDEHGFSFDPDAEERTWSWEHERDRYATEAQWATIQAHRQAPTERDLQALERLATAPTCDVCGGSVTTGGTRHHSCAPVCQHCWRPKTNCFCR